MPQTPGTNAEPQNPRSSPHPWPCSHRRSPAKLRVSFLRSVSHDPRTGLRPSPKPSGPEALAAALVRSFAPFSVCVSHGPQSEPRPSPLPWPRSPRRALGSCSRSVFVSFVFARASNGTSPLARAVAARASPQPWHVFRVVFFLFPRRPQAGSRLSPWPWPCSPRRSPGSFFFF